MPKLKPATQRARREHILDAAEVCFAHSGFHRTTKEDLIAGMAERERAEFAERFAELSAAPDFMKALSDLGERYLVEEPVCKDTLGTEIGLESMRNPKVGAIYRSVDRFVRESFEKLFRRLAQEGRIAPDLDIPMVANLFSIIADGMSMRRATEPACDA